MVKAATAAVATAPAEKPPQPKRAEEDSASIKLLLGVMKLARDTKRNYIWRIKEYLRYIGRTPDASYCLNGKTTDGGTLRTRAENLTNACQTRYP